MKVKLLTLAFIALAFVMSQDLLAEDSPIDFGSKSSPIYIGPVIGFNNVSHSTTLQSFSLTADDKALCPVFNSGSSAGFFAGMSLEIPFGDVANSRSSIIARFLYNTMPGTLDITGTPYPTLVKISNSDVRPEDVKSTHEIDVDYSMFTFEAMFKLNFFNSGIGIVVGPTFDLAMTKKRTQKLKLLSPDNIQFDRDAIRKSNGDVTFENNDRTIVMPDTKLADAQAFRFAIKAGLQYELLFNKLYVVPGVYYNFGVTKLSAESDWRVSALQIQLDIRYALKSPF